MAKMKTYQGYQENFFDNEYQIALPRLSPRHHEKVAPVAGTADNVLCYQNYSILQNKERRFPFYTAANIDGHLFRKLSRKDLFSSGRDRWRCDPRIDRAHQWGYELYRAPKSDFDRGHMTKREDVQWGRTKLLAKDGAKSTFFYTNCMPQHKDLNRALWRELEDYILHDETVAHSLKINLFTGPAFLETDPVFVSRVKKQEVQIPSFFWKVIYYPSGNGTLCRVGFMISQEQVLLKNKIVEPAPVDRGVEPAIPPELLFLDFEKADTYQVNVPLIEEMTGLHFHPAREPFLDKRPSKLIMEEVAIRGLGAPKIKGLVL